MTNAENTDNACRDVNVYNADNFTKESVDMKNDNDVAVNWYCAGGKFQLCKKQSKC